MISYIKGKIIELDFTSVCLLTNSGLGYDLGINEKIYSQLAFEQEVELYVYHHITENNESLFAFISLNEKKVFKELIKISGIGGKVAMQILSLGIENLVNAVSLEDERTIQQIKGVGKKMAEKIILELKDKDFGIIVGSKGGDNNISKISNSLYDSIKTTLINMGYVSRDIDKVLLELPPELNEAGEILPYIIKKLS